MSGVMARVEEDLRTRVRSQKTGDRLPSERELVEELSASRSTIRIILIKLTAEGLIEPQHGRGYFVR